MVADAFGPDLPLIRDWTEQHFDFAGYVSGFDPEAFADREKLRAELGYRPGEQICIVTVGGSGVGGHLLRRVVDAFPEAKALDPNSGWSWSPGRGSTLPLSPRSTDSRRTPTSTTSTGTWLPAISRWSREG